MTFSKTDKKSIITVVNRFNLNFKNMDKISEMPPAFESVKNQLFKEFPNERNEGLNTSRVKDFIRQEGLEIKPYIIIDRNDLPRVRKIVGGTGLLRLAFNNNEGGYIVQKWI